VNRLGHADSSAEVVSSRGDRASCMRYRVMGFRSSDLRRARLARPMPPNYLSHDDHMEMINGNLAGAQRQSAL
jgi:hypothetical protein